MQFGECGKFARSDQIDELVDTVGDIKWADVKNKTLSEKFDYWNSQYETMTCEHAKMKTLVKIRMIQNPIHSFD